MLEESIWINETPNWRGGRRDAMTGHTRWDTEEGVAYVDVGPADWRAFRRLTLHVNSSRPTRARVRVEVLGCEDRVLGRAVLVVDWKGERALTYALGDLEPRDVDPERWHLVHTLRLSCERGGLYPTILTLGAVQVEGDAAEADATT